MSEPTQNELNRWDRDHYWHAFTQMSEYRPWIIERAQGCVLIDSEGREYLDGVSSMWCNIHGHRHPRLDAALTSQLERVAHCTSLGASNPTAIELAKRLVDLAPQGLTRVFFSDDGATAVEVALKMAFQYWKQRTTPSPQKTKFMALGDAYHGDTLGAVSVGGRERFHSLFDPLLFEVLRLPLPDGYRSPPSVQPGDVLDHYLCQADYLLQERHREIAAFVVEPLVQCAAGILTHPPGYLRGIRELTRRYDVLLIADEVAVGMGRTGTMFACEQEEVVPDFLCLAKGLTGGYLPLAATVTNEEIFTAFSGTHNERKTFFHGHTYGGNPLGAAVALATLAVFQEERTLTHLPKKIDLLTQHLCQLAEHPHVGDTRQRGMIVGVELVRDRVRKTPYLWDERRGELVCEHARSHGVFLRPLGNVIVVMPPLSITCRELDYMMNVVREGVNWATRD